VNLWRFNRAGEFMSNDPLPLPEIWLDPPNEDERRHGPSEFFANARSGLVLVEYGSGYPQLDARPALRPIDRVEVAVTERSPSSPPAAMAKALADIAPIVAQAETLLRAHGTLASDVHFAVERIHDVAMALRMREVDTALCDTLDASVREVGDAIVRNEAAAAGALSAAALLFDVRRRLDELMALASRDAVSEPEPIVRPFGMEVETETEARTEAKIEAVVQAEAEARSNVEDAPADDFSAGPEPEIADMPVADTAADILVADDDQARSLHPSLSDETLPETQAQAAAKDPAPEPAEPIAPAVPRAEQESDVARPANDQEVRSASTAHTIEAAVPVAAAAYSDPEPPPAAAPSLSIGETQMAVAAKSRAPSNDPLAALYGLSEEELIALFS